MKRALIIFLASLMPCSVFAASFTSKATGNWSSSGQTTWNEVGVPGSGDTVTISNGHTITQDSDVTVGATIVEGRMTQATGVTLTMQGSLTIGNGASKDGQFDFGPGATLALGSNNLVLNNCKLTSNASPSNWSTVTGTGAISTGAVYTAPKQDIDLSYNSFQNSGAITLAAAGTSGIFTNQIIIEHCSFNGTGTSNITFGTAGQTPAGTVVSINYNDFRNIGHIYFSGAAASTGVLNFRHNTVENSTIKSVVMNKSNGTIEHNVFINYDIGFTQSSVGQNLTIQYNFFKPSDSSSSGHVSVLTSVSGVASTVKNNYFYASSNNYHGVGSTGSGGSGTFDVSNNIFEVVYNTDGANITYASGAAPVNAHHNLLIGTGSMCNNVGAKTIQTYKCYNNTVYTTLDDLHNGQLYITETGLATGTIDIYNNIVYGNVTVARGVKNLAASTQVLGNVGYNNYYNVTTPYVNVGTELSIVTDNTPSDKSIDPRFSDASRKLAKWNLSKGSGEDSVVSAVATLLSVNGYNSTSKTQSDTPSGAAIYGNENAIVNWVASGFAPRNMSLALIGYGGTFIGAFEPVEVSGAALLMGYL